MNEKKNSNSNRRNNNKESENLGEKIKRIRILALRCMNKEIPDSLRKQL